MTRIALIKSFFLREHPFAIAFLMIAVGISLRLMGLDFDAGQRLHPDERFLTSAITAVQWPDSTGQYFASEFSPLNPTNHGGFDFYVYGDLPLFLGKALVDVTSRVIPESPVLRLRGFSVLIDILLIVCVFFVAKEVFGYHTGLLAAAFYALAVLPIQLSHFFTVDLFLSLFITISLPVHNTLYSQRQLHRRSTGGALLGSGPGIQDQRPDLCARHLFSRNFGDPGNGLLENLRLSPAHDHCGRYLFQAL